MSYLSEITWRRGVTLLVIVLAALTAGTWVTMQWTTVRLVHEDARGNARDWAYFLAANVSDLKEIAAGELPSVTSTAFLDAARKSRQVFRYVIYNRRGYSQFVADSRQIGSVDMSELSAEAARAVNTRQTVIDTAESNTPDTPEYFARAYVPVIVDGEAVGVVAAFVDETDQRALFQSTFLIAVVALSGLTALAFAIPAIAWYRRTREKQHSDRRIRYLAHHDALTGLTNRARLIERLENILTMLPPLGTQLAVHFIDLDHFKDVNDSLGHDCGDFLLKNVAARLRNVVRVDDVVARLGGDEFVVLQSHVTSKVQAQHFAERIIAALSQPLHFGQHQLRVEVTIGIAMAPQDGNTAERVLKSADLALYTGKSAGRHCAHFFTPEMDDALRERLSLEKLLRDAAATGHFELYYQPVFEKGGTRLVGYETLLRLPAPDGSLILPDRFIVLAEEMRLIDRIGAWVLNQACRTAVTWPSDLTIAVNLSPAQFESGDIVGTVAGALKETGLAPSRLELEIVEKLLLDSSESTMRQLHALKELGVSIVMDDFGTGYSSLAYLWKFPFDKIKIDRSFIQHLANSGSREVETVIKTIIALGRELHMRVTVEGVETRPQADFLESVDADQLQGFFFGQPMPATDLAPNRLLEIREGPPLLPAPANLLKAVG
jgi:diguanylate cyclase (GGDEF)-like protein